MYIGEGIVVHRTGTDEQTRYRVKSSYSDHYLTPELDDAGLTRYLRVQALMEAISSIRSHESDPTSTLDIHRVGEWDAIPEMTITPNAWSVETTQLVELALHAIESELDKRSY